MSRERDYANLIFGLALGVVITAVSFRLAPPPLDLEPECDKLERQFTAYRHCLQDAGRMGCSMTPQDFISYYETKARLERCESSP